MEGRQYAGFWIRTFAAIIDSVLILLLMTPMFMMFGFEDTIELFGTTDIIINLLIIAATLAFWIYKGATPGKMVTKIKIIDAKTGGKLTIGQSILRYIGYFIGIIPLFFGIFWVGFDQKKQGWHDKIASTVVVKSD